MKIADVSIRPTPDIFQGGQTQTTSEFWIYPRKQRAGIGQVDSANSISEHESLGFIITRPLSLNEDDNDLWRPDEEATKEYLNSNAGQNLLIQVSEGWYTEWDGNNDRGKLTSEAEAALDTLLVEINNLPYIQWSYWVIDEYLDDWLQEGPITTKTSPEELEKMAKEIEEEAVKDNIVFDEDVLEFLERYQQESFLSDE